MSRPSAWTSWTTWASPGGEPNPPTNVATENPSPRVIVVRWNPPADPTDVDRYRVRIVRNPATDGTIVETARVAEGTHQYRWHIPKSERDAHPGANYRGRVDSIEAPLSTAVDDDPPSEGTFDAEGASSTFGESGDQTDTSTIDGDQITPGTITVTELSDSIVPPVVVSSLPSLPDSEYPEGTIAYLTTDEKLYRSTGSSWTSTIYATDLGDSVQAGQLAANSVTAGTIAASAVGASQISVASLSAISANFGTITSGSVFSSFIATSLSGGSNLYILLNGDASGRDQLQFVAFGTPTNISTINGGIRFGGGVGAGLGWWGSGASTHQNVSSGLGTGGTAGDGTVRTVVNQLVNVLSGYGIT
jgi:hypothetical protein